MRIKMTSVCCTLMLLMSMLLISAKDVQAASDDPILDGSYLTYDEESIGYDTKITRGEDLLTGYSKCVRLGPGRLYAGGTTIAAHTVENVQISVIVERAQKGDDSWSGYDNWHAENSDTDRVGSNRALAVEGGYYYRVRCTHSANSDMSSSFTDGVYIEEP
ncbi:hypothetical protein ACQRBN_12505 [Bariatricus sp. SGI.154]|uniref:hypothetical protein n=1 Tax=Bariatricus sp. SGI.154 TaxID=3420549 RepID=UPI003CFED640